VSYQWSHLLSGFSCLALNNGRSFCLAAWQPSEGETARFPRACGCLLAVVLLPKGLLDNQPQEAARLLRGPARWLREHPAASKVTAFVLGQVLRLRCKPAVAASGTGGSHFNHQSHSSTFQILGKLEMKMKLLLSEPQGEVGETAVGKKHKIG